MLPSIKRLISLDAFRGIAIVIVSLSYFGGHLPEFCNPSGK
ncbi:MAG: hypothetical protein QXD42_02760 [Nitrososphaerales archaeon]